MNAIAIAKPIAVTNPINNSALYAINETDASQAAALFSHARSVFQDLQLTTVKERLHELAKV